MKSKTYRWILGLFLIMLYGAITIFTLFTTRDNFHKAKEIYLHEYHFLATNMIKDLIAYENKGYESDKALEICYLQYTKQYKKQNVYLQLYTNRQLLFSQIPYSQDYTEPRTYQLEDTNYNKVYQYLSEDQNIDTSMFDIEQTSIKAQTRKIENRNYLQLVGYLPEPYNQYFLVYYVDITKLSDNWNHTTFTLYIGAIIFSSVLSICLIFLLEYLFRPLEKISEASKRIAKGNYQEKLDIKGEGEINEVVQSFNTMSATIKEQMQHLKENAEEKQCLIDNLAHELRTPLTAIYGYAEYMQKTRLTEEDKYASTQFILQESHRLKSISEMLLTSATLREERVLEKKTIPLAPLFDRVYLLEEAKLNQKNIHFNLELQLETIDGNEDLLESMLINLLDNAIKACNNADSRISLKAYSQDEQKIIEVTDTGKGMTAEQMRHITEPFYRVDKSRSRSEGGNGLGLALCQEIATKHHAHLVFSSQVGVGTSAKVIFNT